MITLFLAIPLLLLIDFSHFDGEYVLMTSTIVTANLFPLRVTIENLALANPHDRALGLVGRANLIEDREQGIALYPGEVSEILIRIQNTGNADYWWTWSFGEETPSDLKAWCESIPELQMIAAGEVLEYPLFFRLPDIFFESDSAISIQNSRLKLEYSFELMVHGVINSDDRKLIGYQFFNVYLRPKVGFLDFLPAFYGESDFGSRFLYIFEQVFQPYIDTIDTLWAYLDPLTAPSSMLPFLAHWVAWKIEPDWDLEQQRVLIRNAMELYRWHGTRYGLRFYLHLYTGLPFDEEHIAIEEEFAGGFTFGNCQVGENALFGGGRGYHFIVRLRWDSADDDFDRIRAVIEKQKPPFCTYDLDCDYL